MQTRTTLDLRGKMDGLPYQGLSKLNTGGLDATATYFNEYTENRYKVLSSIFCQGVLCVNDRDSGSPELFIRAATMAIYDADADPSNPNYSKALPPVATHGHVNFVGSIQEALDDENGHHVYLVHIQSWTRSVAGGVATALICCVVPPWKAQSLGRLRLRSTAQFVGNILGLYPGNSGSDHLCVLAADVAFVSAAAAPSSTSTEISSSSLSSPRKRRLAQLPGGAAQPPSKSAARDETPAAPKRSGQEGDGNGAGQPRKGKR